MYDPVALDLSYVNRTLPRHYDSDEEDISESEGHASPLDAHKRSATLDSILSVSDGGHEQEQNDEQDQHNPESGAGRPAFSRLLSLPTDLYVPSEPLTSPRNSFNSASSASVYSDDESDIFVAEQVTYVEHAKPNLILISPTESCPSSSFPPRDGNLPSPSSSASSGSVYSNDEASRSQPVLGEPWPHRGRDHSPFPSRPLHTKTPGSLSALDTLKNCGPRQAVNEPMSAPAVEAPRPLSFRARSMSFSRPQTPAADARRRLQKEPSRRPPSAQSTATFSLFPAQSQSRTSTPILTHGNGHEDSCASSTYSLPLSSSQPPSRNASPSPYSCGSPAYNRSRSGSLYSVSSMSAAHSQATGKRPPLPYRGSISMVKSRSSTMPMGGYSSSSLRAELNPQPEEQKTSSKSKSKTHSSKKSMKQSKDKESETPSSAKSFVGFMLRGKRKSVIKN
ncbi:hypothetical protein AN8116.2 [Aspergillus nidulans FGSC A4]|uniref:Uncharacterized protein n=1 Tax=Emericella nidulans (strain FGSC A4 / ATCC 38163 / CBS 112.46 / NRRL 194 / M139) TaxID=227321 RepID=Q5AUB4_EMENI|nr:hypothetical protein [Aspergillus nidulans FGSC A4]EAA59738.1 hypothetical protein AN8116.2 [Aspergillus nidulans FGSC A4]CBF73919.1 TPA: hypothetical protein ANIA_08116 [Aspergillus nidulans FGSC A4]|eukprot:XP_681385.1 hypothetical protein AN8116.2 [Aspergillus nidulans FGSC A4]